MPTAIQLIESAALKIGAISTGESITADEASDCLDILNSMLDYWAIDKAMVFQIVQNTHSWLGGQATRTIGPTGAQITATRPIKIEDGSFFRVNEIDYPFVILRNRASYDTIVSKTDQTTYPDSIYYEPSYPNGKLYVYPVPTDTITLYLNSWQVLQNFTSLTTSLSLPPGYQWMIEHNLSVALEPVFTVPVSSSVRSEAMRSMAMIKRINHIPITSATETMMVLNQGRRSDIYSDQ